MNNISWILLALIFLLDILFSAVRSSLLNAHPVSLIKLREKNPRGVDRTVTVLERKRLRVTLRISLILTHFLISVATVWALLDLIPAPQIWLLAIIVIVAAILVLLIEFAIEGLILHDPESWAVKLAPIGEFMSFIFSPVALLMMAVLGSPEILQQRLGPVTEEELKTWVESGQGQGSLDKGEREMIYSIFQFGDTLSREVMIPRIDITALDVNANGIEAIKTFTESGHSRVPVYEETIDEVIGLLYAKDLLSIENPANEITDIRPFLRKAYFIPESKNVDELLHEMQAQGIHLAIVVDEYGGTAGLVTLEDIVEEIVGEIRDEYDQSEEYEYQIISPDEVVFSGLIDLDDVYDILGVDLRDDMADTLGGYIYGRIGRVPIGGEQIIVGDWMLTVAQVSGRRIRKILAKRMLIEPQNEDENDTTA